MNYFLKCIYPITQLHDRGGVRSNATDLMRSSISSSGQSAETINHSLFKFELFHNTSLRHLIGDSVLMKLDGISRLRGGHQLRPGRVPTENCSICQMACLDMPDSTRKTSKQYLFIETVEKLLSCSAYVKLPRVPSSRLHISRKYSKDKSPYSTDVNEVLL